jgi:hypothetical protein
MLANAKPRFFIRGDGAVNEAEFADTNKAMVHVDGNLGQDSIAPIYGKPLNEIYVKVISDKIDELKETTGNRDVSNGGTTGGVTAASGMAAMMEAGAKLDRDGSKAAYRAFRKVIHMIIENIRQFYDAPRSFRIMGDNGAQEFVSYSNAGIQPQAQGMEMGVDMGYRLPLFDIEISAQKASPYSKLSQNELALQFFGAGFFNPAMADQALATLEMMDFERKDFIRKDVAFPASSLVRCADHSGCQVSHIADIEVAVDSCGQFAVNDIDQVFRHLSESVVAGAHDAAGMYDAGIQASVMARIQDFLCSPRFAHGVAAHDFRLVKIVNLLHYCVVIRQIRNGSGTGTIYQLLHARGTQAELDDIFSSSDVHVYDLLVEVRSRSNDTGYVQHYSLTSFRYIKERLKALHVRKVALHDFRFFRDKFSRRIIRKNKCPHLFSLNDQLTAYGAAKETGCPGYQI